MDDDRDDNFPPTLPHKPNPYDLNSKIMLTAIVSLMMVVVLVVILHIYARCVLGRQARRRAALQHLSLRVARLHSAEQQAAPKSGLDPMVIAILPVFKYKGAGDGVGVGDEEEQVGPECAVCLSALEEEEMARLLPNCNHIFHADCIDKWFSSHTNCPICRTEAKPEIRPEPFEPPLLAPCHPLPLGRINSSSYCVEGTSDGSAAALSKGVAGSSSRFNSFRKILSRERLSQRIQPRGVEVDIVEDIESQRQ